MKKINTPTKPGIYGYSTSDWLEITFVQVYCLPHDSHLRSKTVGSTYRGTLMGDVPVDGEWYALSLWDRLRLAVAKMFGIHNWPKRTLRVMKCTAKH